MVSREPAQERAGEAALLQAVAGGPTPAQGKAGGEAGDPATQDKGGGSHFALRATRDRWGGYRGGGS